MHLESSKDAMMLLITVTLFNTPSDPYKKKCLKKH